LSLLQGIKTFDKTFAYVLRVFGLVEELLMLLEDLLNRWPLLGLLMQACRYEVAELRRPFSVPRQGGSRRVEDDQEHSHGRQVVIGRITHRQFDCCDSEGPDVSFKVVAVRLFHYFRSHPARRPDESLPLVAGLDVGAHTEVAEVDVAFAVHEDVACLDVSVDLALAVEIIEGVRYLPYDRCDQLFVLNSVGIFDFQTVDN